MIKKKGDAKEARFYIWSLIKILQQLQKVIK